jgi:hypothetical protein
MGVAGREGRMGSDAEKRRLLAEVIQVGNLAERAAR